AFAIDQKYKVQFEGMHTTARLPAKLLLYQAILDLMREANRQGKQLLIFTDGEPAMQLNKLRHVEWNGLDQAVKVYFKAELRARGYTPLDYLLQENGLQKEDVLYIHSRNGHVSAVEQGVDCLPVTRFLGTSNVFSTLHTDSK